MVGRPAVRAKAQRVGMFSTVDRHVESRRGRYGPVAGRCAPRQTARGLPQSSGGEGEASRAGARESRMDGAVDCIARMAARKWADGAVGFRSALLKTRLLEAGRWTAAHTSSARPDRGLLEEPLPDPEGLGVPASGRPGAAMVGPCRAVMVPADAGREPRLSSRPVAIVQRGAATRWSRAILTARRGLDGCIEELHVGGCLSTRALDQQVFGVGQKLATTRHGPLRDRVVIRKEGVGNEQAHVYGFPQRQIRGKRQRHSSRGPADEIRRWRRLP